MFLVTAIQNEESHLNSMTAKFPAQSPLRSYSTKLLMLLLHNVQENHLCLTLKKIIIIYIYIFEILHLNCNYLEKFFSPDLHSEYPRENETFVQKLPMVFPEGQGDVFDSVSYLTTNC